MRAIRRVDLSVGPLRVPVRMYRATGSHDIALHTYHVDCLGSVGMTRQCKLCGSTVDAEETVRGADLGTVVVVSEEELEKLRGAAEPVIYVEHFIGLGEVDPIFWDVPYYLEAEGPGSSYVLVRQALLSTRSMALVRFNFGRETMGVVRVMSDALVMHTLHWDDEVRDVGELDIPRGGSSRTSSARMTRELLASMSGKFDRSKLVDGFTAKLSDLLERRYRVFLDQGLKDSVKSAHFDAQ